MKKKYKQCRHCKLTKPMSDFYHHPNTLDKRGSWCKQCGKNATTASRLNPEHKNRWTLYTWRSSLRHLYGIEPAQYEAMLIAQNGLCAICRTNTLCGPGKRLHVDHCAMTKRVRGLLCSNCNNGIGRFLHNPALLRLAAQYLEAHS